MARVDYEMLTNRKGFYKKIDPEKLTVSFKFDKETHEIPIESVIRGLSELSAGIEEIARANDEYSIQKRKDLYTKKGNLTIHARVIQGSLYSFLKKGSEIDHLINQFDSYIPEPVKYEPDKNTEHIQEALSPGWYD